MFGRRWCAVLLTAVALGQDQDPAEEFRKEFAAIGVKKAPDRAACSSCHLGIDDPAFRVDEVKRRSKQYRFADPELQKRFEERYPLEGVRLRMTRAFMAHPRLDLFVGAGSRHAGMDCLACHGGSSRLDELGSERERLLWQQEYVQRHPVDARTMLVRTPLVQSSCYGCHGGAAEMLDGAETFAHGAKVMRGESCYACHKMPDEPARKPGPPLTHLADKMDKEWAYNFLLNPDSFRPTTRMPRFFPRSTDSDAQLSELLIKPEEGPAVAAAIVEYLYDRSKSRGWSEPPFQPSENEAAVDRGEKIVRQIGCTACHRLDEERSLSFARNQYDKHLKEFGPPLAGLGEKLNTPLGRKWLYHWLKNPREYYPQTRMPEFRLTDAQLRDVVEYLCSLRIEHDVRELLNQKRKPDLPPIPAWKPQPPPSEDEAMPVVERLAEHFGGKGHKTGRDKMLFVGKRMIEYWGCYSCHEIEGVSQDAPTGEPWSMKLLPGKGVFKRMPFSRVSENESTALKTYLLGVTRPPKTVDARYRGMRVLAEYNCAGCHQMSAEKFLLEDGWHEGPVRAEADGALFVDWLVPSKQPRDKPLRAFLDRRPAVGGDIVEPLKAYKRDVLKLEYPHEGHLQARMPPSLRDVGAKLRADWLRGFLKNPHEVRPLLREPGSVQMPRFHLTDAEIDALIAYWGASDDPPPTSAKGDLQRLQTCFVCHLPGERGWAPDLAQVEKRLRARWLESYLRDPLAHQPGSLMPAVDEKDVPALVEALRSYSKLKK